MIKIRSEILSAVEMLIANYGTLILSWCRAIARKRSR